MRMAVCFAENCDTAVEHDVKRLADAAGRIVCLVT